MNLSHYVDTSPEGVGMSKEGSNHDNHDNPFDSAISAVVVVVVVVVVA